MKPKSIETEVLRAKAIAILQAMKSQRELEIAFQSLAKLQNQEVIGYNLAGEPITHQTLIDDHDAALLELEKGELVDDSEVEAWLLQRN
jgi:hypothetical protein